jgi:hypothetical protein
MVIVTDATGMAVRISNTLKYRLLENKQIPAPVRTGAQ